MDAPPATSRDSSAAFATWAQAVMGFAARRPVLFVLAVAAALYLPWLEAAPVSGSIEGHRLVAAREMVQSGDWVVPRLNGEIYLAKPPFQYWLIALLSLPFGDTTLWTARVVSGLSVVALCALVAFWVGRELSSRAAVRAGLMVALSGVLLEKGVLAELEAVLAVTTTATLALLWFSLWSETRARLLVLGAGLALGAAVLTKGPVPLLPFSLFSGALAVTAGERRGRALRHAGAVLAIAVLAAVPWLLLLLRRAGLDATLSVFGYEVLHRLHSPGEANREPLWYYGPALLSALFPVSLLLPAAAVAWRRERRAAPRRRALLAALVSWSLGTALLLSLSAGKEVRYLIATVPAWCFLIAWGLEARSEVPWLRGYARALGRAATWLWCVLSIGLVAGGWWLGELPAACLAAGLLAGAALLARFGGARAALPALVLLLAGAKVAWAKGYLAHRRHGSPVMEAGARMAEWIPEDAPVCILPRRYSSPVHFGLNRPMVVVPTPREAPLVRPGEPAFLLVDSDRALRAARESDPAWEVLGSWRLRKRDYRLLRRPPAPEDEP